MRTIWLPAWTLSAGLTVPGHRLPIRTAIRAGVEFYALHKGGDRLVMIEKYESARARAEHAKRTALAKLLSALDGKLARELDVQVFTPHPAGDRRKGALAAGVRPPAGQV